MPDRTGDGAADRTFRRARAKRVLVLNHFALPRSGAGGTRHVELFGRLDGWDVTILAADKGLHDQAPVVAEPPLRTVPVPRYSGNGPGRVANWVAFSALGLFRGLVGPRPTVVYGSSPHLLAALSAYLISVARRSSFVLEVRDLWPQILVDAGMMSERAVVYRLLKRLERFLYRRADRIVVLAEGSRTVLIDTEGVPADKIRFVPNGAEPSDFDVTTDRTVLRAHYGLDGFVIVYAGAHGPANGLGFVLDAAAELAVRHPEVRFLLVGDGVSKPDLVAEANERGLRNVAFHDPVPKSEMPALLAACDAGLHCLADVPLFRHGVSPNKLYDYMAAGRPVITNTPGEVAELVRAADGGVTTEPANIAAGVERLVALDADRLAAMGASGRRWMEQHRSRRVLAARLGELLVDLIEERSDGSR